MAPVQLAVYDLSRGLAAQLSVPLTGKYIEGIWHTAVLAFGKEVFFGQGIFITKPGTTHHGQPMRVHDMGDTGIDEETFLEYIEELRTVYTAEKYHLLDHNCNHFSADVIGFLTGATIPSYISDLPSDFLSTPFGQMIRPQIDQMFRSAGPSPIPTPPTTASPSPAPPTPSTGGGPSPIASMLLQAVAAQAASARTPSSSPAPPQPARTPSSSIHTPNSLQTFLSLLQQHTCVVAFFTSATCAPCRIIAPAFEDAARQHADRAAFVKVDLGVGMAGQIAERYGVRATPTFITFLRGEKYEEVRGADAKAFRTAVDLLIFTAFPPHPHASLSLPTIRALPTQPILFTTPPDYTALLAKLRSFPSAPVDALSTLETTIIPALQSSTFTPDVIHAWERASSSLLGALHPPELFPVLDLLRLGVLDKTVSSYLAVESSAGTSTSDPLSSILRTLASLPDAEPLPRPTALTALRLLSNSFAHTLLAQRVLSPDHTRPDLTALLVRALLHSDAGVRTAAASLAVNVAAFVRGKRAEDGREKRGEGEREGEEGAEDQDGEWETEVVSALVEALGREENEEAVHRLAAALAHLVHLSPRYADTLQPLLEVLDARATLLGKANAPEVKREVKKLLEEVAGLC